MILVLIIILIQNLSVQHETERRFREESNLHDQAVCRDFRFKVLIFATRFSDNFCVQIISVQFHDPEALGIKSKYLFIHHEYYTYRASQIQLCLS